MPPHCIEHLDERTNITFSICEVSSSIYIDLNESRLTQVTAIGAAISAISVASAIQIPEQGTSRFCYGRHFETRRVTADSDRSLIQIEGVNDTKAANFYLGKKIAFVYRAQREIRGTKIRVIWGKVTRPHGIAGVVRAQFRSNLPPKTFGASVRVMLYPSSI
ncbi:60S ribosomal protein L33B [Peltigera leucophlebia]|nr:60S ribosomal protein L33B [Peltigera leucophlebia]